MCIICCWLIHHLSGLWLIYPDLVFTLPLPYFWWLFMISVLCTSPLMSESCLLTNRSVLASTPLICWVNVLSPDLSFWYAFTCVPAAYGLNTLLCSFEFVSINISSKHQVPFTICSQKSCCFQCLANVSCFACDQGACLCYHLYVWSPLVISDVTLYNHPMVHHSTTAQLLMTPQEKKPSFCITALYILILLCFKGLIVCVICIEVDGLPINLG